MPTDAMERAVINQTGWPLVSKGRVQSSMMVLARRGTGDQGISRDCSAGICDDE
jgi:hypothetical protein